MVETISSGLSINNNSTNDSTNSIGGLVTNNDSTGYSGLTFYSGQNTNFSNMMRVFQKINNVMTDLGWVGKDGRVTVGGGYDYTTEGALIAAVRPLMVQYGLVFFPTQIVESEILPYDNKSGTKTFLTTMKIKYIIGDVDSGEFVEVEVMSQGADSGDKGVYKALTGAFKYALRQAFMIGTGDDPEATDEEGNDTSYSAPKQQYTKRQSGGDYAPEKKSAPETTPTSDANHYIERVRKALESVDLQGAKEVFKKRKINVGNLPSDQPTLLALYEMAREIKGGKSAEAAAADFDAKLG